VQGESQKDLDFSIIIAHRGNTLGLWATIHSVDAELEHSPWSYEYVICTNGEEKLHADTITLLHYLTKSGKLASVEHSVEPLSPPSARERAVKASRGKYLFFFDNHVLVAPKYFERAMAWMGKGHAMLHSSTRFYAGEKTVYHYQLKLERNFWADGASEPTDPENPYRILAGGHGGFVVRRDVWDKVGGYWDGFVGYGGEEMYFDLKMALLGYNNWLDPKMIHYHFAGNRGYSRHYTDDYYVNMLACANIIGGNDWLMKVYQNFSKNYPKMQSRKSMFDLLMIADERSKEHAEWLAGARLLTLDELLDRARQAKISC
jgi:hypothetical protein